MQLCDYTGTPPWINRETHLSGGARIVQSGVPTYSSALLLAKAAWKWNNLHRGVGGEEYMTFPRRQKKLCLNKSNATWYDWWLSELPMWFTGAVSWIWRGMSGEFIRDKRRLEYEVTLHCYSRFTQTHKIGNIAIIAEFVFPCICIRVCTKRHWYI